MRYHSVVQIERHEGSVVAAVDVGGRWCGENLLGKHWTRDEKLSRSDIAFKTQCVDLFASVVQRWWQTAGAAWGLFSRRRTDCVVYRRTLDQVSYCPSSNQQQQHCFACRQTSVCAWVGGEVCTSDGAVWRQLTALYDQSPVHSARQSSLHRARCLANVCHHHSRRLQHALCWIALQPTVHVCISLLSLLRL